MAAPYSVDFRTKVIALYKTKKMTQQELANTLSISLSTVKRYWKLDREHISLEPKVEGKGRPAKVDDDGYQLIEQLISANPNITLRELSNIYFKKKKIHIGRSILSRACQQMKLTKKKLSLYSSQRDTKEIKKKIRVFGRNSKCSNKRFNISR